MICARHDRECHVCGGGRDVMRVGNRHDIVGFAVQNQERCAENTNSGDYVMLLGVVEQAAADPAFGSLDVAQTLPAVGLD